MSYKDVDEILRKHGASIDRQISTTNIENVNYSREYVIFKNEIAKDLTRYEKWCRSLGNVIKIKIAEKDYVKIKKNFDIAHVDAEPSQAAALSIMVLLSVFLIGMIASVAIFFITNEIPLLFFVLTSLLSVFLFYFVQGYPSRLANKWRLKASSQMVPAVLYVVVYMRHTPNLEKAIAFASEHLEYPLSLDFKKIFYDVQIGRFSTLKESLDNYLEIWRDYSPEFIEAFHLIESSLFEPDESRRIMTLEKSLQVVLDGVYEKMLKFSHDAKSPLTNVYMLGVVLPTLGLALLPLASAMVGDIIKWYHVFILFNLIVPFLVFYLTDKVLYLRPGGYGETGLLEKNPFYSEYNSNKHYFGAFLIALPLLLIGLVPLIFQYTSIPALIGLKPDYTFAELGISLLGDLKIFGVENGFGPFGVGALVLSLFFPLGIALFFSSAYKHKTKKIIVERENTRNLEREFNSSLFQLGNRLGNGVPPELVFGKVADSSRGLHTEDFFRKVNYNIQNSGMSVEKSIFDNNRGALIYFPSQLIATSMRILVESSKKGLKIAALSLMAISEYVKNIEKIRERLRDLLAEIISDMKSNMTFLAPLLSGIVVALAAMITTILSKLSIPEFGGDATALGGFTDLLKIFDLTKMIPPYFLQISIGLYLIQIIFILTNTLVVIDSGEDKLQKTNRTGKYLIRGMTLYFIVALIGILTLSFLAAIVLGNI